MRFYKWLLLTLLLTASSASHANLWIEGQYGKSTSSEHRIFGIEVNAMPNNKVYTLGLTENDACFLFCLSNVFYSDLYISYGTRREFKSALTFTKQIGISRFRRVDFGCEITCDETVWAIPLDLTVSAIKKHGGIGLNLRVNLNRIETTATLSFSILLGSVNLSGP